jgi:hypothetical protein
MLFFNIQAYLNLGPLKKFDFDITEIFRIKIFIFICREKKKKLTFHAKNKIRAVTDKNELNFKLNKIVSTFIFL